MEKLSCAQAKELDLVDYLATLGYEPAKVRNKDYWYRSPFRDEKTPSFKVNRDLKMWYDHGSGQGGDLVDFGTLYYKCTFRELLDRLAEYSPGITPSFHQPSTSRSLGAGEKKDSPDSKIVIMDTRPIADRVLIDYLAKRGIPLDIAQRSCREVDFRLYGKQQTVIGFPNRFGGYELRNEHFKGSSSPKDISLFDNRTDEIVVFEGFFNFLSFQTINRHIQPPLTNCLVLNSLVFLERSRYLMEQYSRILLAPDRDTAGRTFTRRALEWNPDIYIDRSEYYQGHKDLNDWLIHQQKHPRLSQDRRTGRSL